MNRHLEQPEWELVNESHKNGTMRMKVDGGWLYRSLSYKIGTGENAASTSESMCFVPDVDLARYQAHLRDAYNKGFMDGLEEAKNVKVD